MTSYSRMAANGRAMALETNTSFKLVRIAEYREVQRPHFAGGPSRYGELIGEGGHVVETVRPASW